MVDNHKRRLGFLYLDRNPVKYSMILQILKAKLGVSWSARP